MTDGRTDGPAACEFILRGPVWFVYRPVGAVEFPAAVANLLRVEAASGHSHTIAFTDLDLLQDFTERASDPGQLYSISIDCLSSLRVLLMDLKDAGETKIAFDPALDSLGNCIAIDQLIEVTARQPLQRRVCLIPRTRRPAHRRRHRLSTQRG